MVITEFKGEYRWLSNFWPCEIHYRGYKFKSVEAAYQAAKCRPEDIEPVIAMTFMGPGEAKKLGKKVQLREDWDAVKTSLMFGFLLQKFSPGSHLEKKLLETGDEELIEGNYWGDTFWGVCRGKGHNVLGLTLMLVRRLRALKTSV